MKKRLCLVLALCIFVMFLFGCAKNISEDEFVINYYMSSFGGKWDEFEIEIIDKIEVGDVTYSLLYCYGLGADMMLYKFEKQNNTYNMLWGSHGEYFAGSKHISFNCLDDDNNTIVFGEVTSTYWNPDTNEVTPVDRESIVFELPGGATETVDVSGREYYIACLDEMFESFVVNDRVAEKSLTYEEYTSFFPVNQTYFTKIKEIN